MTAYEMDKEVYRNVFKSVFGVNPCSYPEEHLIEDAIAMLDQMNQHNSEEF